MRSVRYELSALKYQKVISKTNEKFRCEFFDLHDVYHSVNLIIDHRFVQVEHDGVDLQTPKLKRAFYANIYFV